MRIIVLVMLLCGVVRAQEKIDFLDYFAQIDDKNDTWTLGGSDMRWDVDPEGTGEKVLIHSKFSEAGCFEVYKVTDTDIQCRFEVVRSGKHNDFWIRRFEELKATNPAPGALWIK